MPVLSVIDKFPARVTFADGTIVDSVYAFAHAGRVRIWGADGRGGVEKLADEQVISIIAEGGIAHASVPGGSWTIESSPQGCGCGSPLKSFNPRREP